ncbi:TIGR02922 family protein [Thalassotalea sp. G2M2-11]|uniref:TIGR02922 family protein n=1 Tax=Thalassotalea sp. G2M2-11 TaxID=2787627 RepID=UPI0019D2A818|nr:TIGR02922 family protein [Thalassotalea sp. G2M2-11]
MNLQYKSQTVTVIFYDDTSLELMHETHSFIKSERGRVIIPDTFKRGKSIIAVCDGEINIINKVGDRILPLHHVA